MTSLPVFEFQLSAPVLPGLVTVGLFNGKAPAIACATSDDCVLLYSPYGGEESSAVQEARRLNVTHKVTSLLAAPLPASAAAVDALSALSPTRSGAGSSAGSSSAAAAGAAGGAGAGAAGTGAGMSAGTGLRDMLLIGTGQHVQAYDVEGNRDVFFAPLNEGAARIAYGPVAKQGESLVVVGGNCTIQGLDPASGAERFWTVTGDNVTAMAFRLANDADPTASAATTATAIAAAAASTATAAGGDGTAAAAAAAAAASRAPVRDLIVGSEDYCVRVFKQETTALELTESDVVTCVCALQGGLIAYALANGAVGVYAGAQRLWHVKSKFKVTSLCAFDVDGDGILELVVGWATGKVEARSPRSGDLLFKDKLAAPIAAVIPFDYTLSGRPQLVIVSTSGQVKGYAYAKQEQRQAMRANQTHDALRALLDQRAALLQELKQLDPGGPPKRPGAPDDADGPSAGPGTVIPPHTRLVLELVPSVVTQAITLNLGVNNNTVIKALVIYSEVMFPAGGFLVRPPNPTPVVSLPLIVPKNVPADITIKCVVGLRGSAVDHVFELSRTLPPFSMFQLVPVNRAAAPQGFATFRAAGERVNRLLLWVQRSFTVDAAAVNAHAEVTMDRAAFALTHVRSQHLLVVSMVADTGDITVACDDMELVGDIVQDITSWMGLANVESVCDFPAELARLGGLMRTVGELNATRNTMSIDIAEASMQVKDLVVQAEDARMLGRFRDVRRGLDDLVDVNNQLIEEYRKRAANHQALLDSLRSVNDIIQRAAKVRTGSAASAMVALCRRAIKANDATLLAKAIKVGHLADSARALG